MLKKVASLIWFLVIFLFPVYLFDSGGVQIAHGLIIMGLLLQVLRHKLVINAPVRQLFIFSAWCVFVNAIWTTVTGDIFIFKNALFILFNLFAFIYAISILQEQKTLALKLFFWAILGITIVLIFLYFTPYKVYFSEYNESYRYTGSFRNPNQLMFWVLIILVTLLTISNKIALPSKLYFTLEVLLGILMLMTASRSGFVAFLVYLFFRIRKLNFVWIFFILIAFGCIAFYLIDFDEIKGLARVMESVENNSLSISDERGFNRVMDYPQHLIIGAGEGAYYRWNSGIELHSTFLTLLFSYGIVGFSLFCGFVYKLGFKINRDSIAYLLPTSFCFFVHNELRFTILWISLAIFYVMNKKAKTLLN